MTKIILVTLALQTFLAYYQPPSFADRWAIACRDLKCSTFANQIEEFQK